MSQAKVIKKDLCDLLRPSIVRGEGRSLGNPVNEKYSLPVGHVVGMEETYESMKLFLKGVNYSVFKWNICHDLKVISPPPGLQLESTKNMCLCVCNESNHYAVKDWFKREERLVGRHNVQYMSLAE